MALERCLHLRNTAAEVLQCDRTLDPVPQMRWDAAAIDKGMTADDYASYYFLERPIKRLYLPYLYMQREIPLYNEACPWRGAAQELAALWVWKRTTVYTEPQPGKMCIKDPRSLVHIFIMEMLDEGRIFPVEGERYQLSRDNARTAMEHLLNTAFGDRAQRIDL